MASMMYQCLPSVLGIIGAGQMGLGIAQVAAQKGLRVLLNDNNAQKLDRASQKLRDAIEKAAKKSKQDDTEVDACMDRISFVPNLEALKDAEFVIEAVPEDEDLKRTVMRNLDKITTVQTILASNTSSISITRLAAATSKPHRMVGMHFMYPVPLSPLVQLAKGVHTSQQTYEVARGLAELLGKQVCVSQDHPGFVVHRVLLPMINEALFCLMEGVGTAEDIDRGMRLGANMAMGPLRMADTMGLDTCLSILRVLHQSLGDPKYRPCPLLYQYVDGGKLGVKTGRGIFQYEHSLKNE